MVPGFRLKPPGRTKRAALGKRLFGFRNRKFAAGPVKQEACSIQVLTFWSKGMYLEYLLRVLGSQTGPAEGTTVNR